MFFFLFVDVRIVSREVNVNDFPSCDIDDRDKVLCKNQGRFGEKRSPDYQRMCIEIVVFRVTGEA